MVHTPESRKLCQMFSKFVLVKEGTARSLVMLISCHSANNKNKTEMVKTTVFSFFFFTNKYDFLQIKGFADIP